VGSGLSSGWIHYVLGELGGWVMWGCMWAIEDAGSREYLCPLLRVEEEGSRDRSGKI
jgi:hypothetical protein